MKWVSTVVFLVVFFLTLSTTAFAEEFNAGFVQGLWYGSEQIFAEEPTRIYVAIRNNTGADLTGTVEFFDNDKRIERNNVSALDGRIIESWADWTPSYGEHTITASLSRIELHIIASGTQAVEVTSPLASDIIFIDYDTDGDGIGNADDLDDDGDGVSDKDEKENGTDPLVPDIQDTDDEDADSETEETNDGDENKDTKSTNTDPNAPQGLERFLTDSVADRTLEKITETVNSSKKSVDSYRDSRSSRNEPTYSTVTSDNRASTSEEFEGSFGPVTRTENVDSGGSFVSAILGAFGVTLNGIYTLVLFLLSIYLTHPAIVQLTFIFLILYAFYRLARKYGSRNQ